jgi:dTDP-D-glucose 4,6-dehydratase
MPLPVDDPRRRKPDISRAKAILGWEPKVSLQEGLEATAEWFFDPKNRLVTFTGGRSAVVSEQLTVSIAAE